MKKSRAMCTIRVWGANDSGRLEKARKVVRNLKGVTKVQAYQLLNVLIVGYDPERIALNEIRDSVRQIVRR